MDKRERVLKTLEMEEPDRVPITELEIEVPIMEAITGKEFSARTSLQMPVVSDPEKEKEKVAIKIETYREVGFDMFVVTLSAPEEWELIERSDGTIVGAWGRVFRLDKDRNQWVPYSTVFDSPDDFHDFEFPKPDDRGWTLGTRYAKKLIGEEMAIASFIRDPFAHAWEMFTPSIFVQWLYQDPEFIEKVIEELTEFNIEIIEKLADTGADLIVSGGDFCEEKGPLVPTKYFKQIIFPNLEKQVKAAHENGIRFVKHTDGNVNPLLDDLAEIVDGVHSLDPTAGVDIGEVKEKYGQDLALMGNVSVDNLANNTPEQIEEETKLCIKKGSPGGGHILSSSNSWAAGAKLENCLKMVKTGKKYGKYPIQ